MGKSSYRAALLHPILGQRLLTASISLAIMDAAGEKIAWEYRAPTTSPIVSVDVKVSYGSAAASTNFKLGVFGSTSDWKPDTATQKGGYTTEFGGVNSQNAFIGSKTFSTDSGTLAVNELVWIVMEYSSGSTLDSTHSAQITSMSNSYVNPSLGIAYGYYTGGAWAVNPNYALSIIVTHADGTISGIPLSAGDAGISVTSIYGSNAQGMKYRLGSAHYIQGCLLRIGRQGTPNNLVIKIYEGSTLKHTENLTLAKVRCAAGGSAQQYFYFATPPLISADADTYIILSQTNGDSSNYWRLQSYPFSSAHIDAFLDPTTRTVYGTNSDPTALSVLTNEVATLCPILSFDGATDFDCAASGIAKGRLIGGI